MKISPVPKEREYYRLFSEHAANLDTAARLLVSLMDDFTRERAKAKAREILEHEGCEILEQEHVGGRIVHDIVPRLDTSFITPPDREDISDLATTMDETSDTMASAGRRSTVGALYFTGVSG